MTADERTAVNKVLIALAGGAAQRRYLRGGAPGWRRIRSTAAMIAHHEAGHAVAQAAAGLIPIHLNMETTLGRSGVSVCDRPGERSTPERLKERLAKRGLNDYRQATRWCLLLASAPGWRAVLRVARQLRHQAEALIDAHWPYVTALAVELERRGVLDTSAIAAFLPKPVEAGHSAGLLGGNHAITS